MSLVFLKVKICSLAAESSIIKRQERKRLRFVHLPSKLNTRTGLMEPRVKVIRNDSLRAKLRSHRRFVVRVESRAAQLAYAYLRQRDYKSTENRSGIVWQSVQGVELWNKVQANIKRFGQEVTRDDLLAWYQGKPFPEAVAKAAGAEKRAAVAAE